MKRISLALQGGGAHGAFTWGVLDRLLEDEDLEIAAVSGTSAGALNGAALKSGLITGGREGARENLDGLWSQMGALPDSAFTAWFENMSPSRLARAVETSPMYMMGEAMTRMVSPYATGPVYINPLEQVVKSLNYDHVCASKGPKLFIGATNVRTGKIRVFSGNDITTDAILASACLPTLFRAVQMDDPDTGRKEAYWDGGYSGNPALYPLFKRDLPSDLVIVNINPIVRHNLPVTPQEIQSRINEISFNAALLRELRAIAFVQRLIDDESVGEDKLRRLFVHMIADDELMNDLSEATKTVPFAPVLTQLKEAGRNAAHVFLTRHKSALGKRNSVDLQALYG